MIDIDEDVIINVLSRRDEIEKDYKDEQLRLYKINAEMNQDIYNALPLSSVRIEEKVQTSGRKQDLGDLTFQIYEEILRQRRNIQDELICLQEQMATVHRILVCYKALPFAYKDVLDKLYIQHQKWEALELSNNSISQRKSTAINLILKLYYSSRTDKEILLSCQALKSGSTPFKKQKRIKNEVNGQMSLNLDLDLEEEQIGGVNVC